MLNVNWDSVLDHGVIVAPILLTLFSALLGEKLVKPRGRRRWIWLIIVAIGVASSIGASIQQDRARKAHDAEIKNYMLSVEVQFKNLKETLNPFIEMAMELHPALDERLALKQLINDFRVLQSSNKSQNDKIELLEYTEISKYNLTGDKGGGSVDGVLFVPTPINQWSDGYIVRSGKDIDFKCDTEAIQKCKEVIRKEPLYPFSHYFLAQCLKDKGESEWQEQALKAREILLKTTTIEGHRTDHDVILEKVNKLLGLKTK